MKFTIDVNIVEGLSSSRSFVRGDQASMFIEAIQKFKTNKVNWRIFDVLVLIEKYFKVTT